MNKNTAFNGIELSLFVFILILTTCFVEAQDYEQGQYYDDDDYYGNYSYYDYGNYSYPEYSDPIEMELTQLTETLMSPGYPSAENPTGTYPANANYIWYRDGDNSTFVQIKFWQLAVEIGEGDSNVTCDFDFVNISITSIGWKKYCGYSPPEKEIKGLGSLFIQLISDGTSQFPGFALTYKITENYNPCDPTPCGNGKCVVENYLPKCNCDKGFTGDQCTVDMDECVSEPCQNGGTCNDRPNGYQCTCVPGYRGSNCEDKIPPPCDAKPCKNGATCKEVRVVSYTCICPPYYTGMYCEIELPSADNCENPGIEYLSGDQKFVPGDKVVFSCIDGYILTGPTELACAKNGSWSLDMPECIVDLSKFDQLIQKYDNSTWKSVMVFLGLALCVNVVVFSLWVNYKWPWMKIGQGNTITKPGKQKDNVSLSSLSFSTDESDLDEKSDDDDSGNYTRKYP